MWELSISALIEEYIAHSDTPIKTEFIYLVLFFNFSYFAGSLILEHRYFYVYTDLNQIDVFHPSIHF